MTSDAASGTVVGIMENNPNTDQVAKQEVDAQKIVNHLLQRISELELQIAVMRSQSED